MRNMFRYLLILSVALCSCEPIDNGQIETSVGLLCPFNRQWLVTHDESLSEENVVEAVEFWNDVSDRVLFNTKSDSIYYHYIDELGLSERSGVITATVGYPRDDDPFDDSSTLGNASLWWNDEARIVTAHITVSPEGDDGGSWTVAILEQELGHTLGLADDPESVDLDSIMSNPVVPGRGVTPGDLDIVIGCF